MKPDSLPSSKKSSKVSRVTACTGLRLLVRQAYSNAAIKSVTNIVTITRSSMFQAMLRFNKTAKLMTPSSDPTAATPKLIRRNHRDSEAGDIEPGDPHHVSRG